MTNFNTDYTHAEGAGFPLGWEWNDLTTGTAKAPNTPPQILVVDDDPFYCKLLKTVASRRQIPITTCASIGELNNLTKNSKFDVAIVDYCFGEFTGTQVGHMLGDSTPIVMISQSKATELTGEAWPHFVRSFIHKQMGMDRILDEALLTARWPGLFERRNQAYTLPRWQLAISILLLVIGLTSVLVFTSNISKSPYFEKRFFWDQNQKNADTVQSDTIPDKMNLASYAHKRNQK